MAANFHRFFFETWAKLTPHIITYAELRLENAEIAFILNELNSGGSGQTADINYKPPQCKIQCFQVISVQIFNIVCSWLITLYTK